MKPLVIAFMIVAGLVGAVSAETSRSSGIVVADAWARATPEGARTGAVYLTVMNHGATDDQLMSVATPVADRAKLHIDSIENGVMRMRPLKQVEVKPGGSTVLKPGAVHIMLIGLEQPLKEGDTFPLTLDFAQAGKREVQVTVAKAGAMGKPGNGAMPGHDMSRMEMMKH